MGMGLLTWEAVSGHCSPRPEPAGSPLHLLLLPLPLSTIQVPEEREPRPTGHPTSCLGHLQTARIPVLSEEEGCSGTVLAATLP